MSAAAILAAVSVPWNVFVAAFLYYTVLTLGAVGGLDLSAAFMTLSYLLPLGLYAAVLVSRGVRALASIRVEIGETPHALIG